MVIDTKSPPLRPDLLEQWYERLRASAGGAPWGSTPREIEAVYDELTTAEFERIARAFGADYFVVSGTVAADNALRSASVFRNAEYAAYRVSDRR